MDLLESLIDWIVGLPTWAAWVAIVLATFVTEDLTCVAAGMIAASGELPATTAIGAAGLGIFLGDLLLYWAGYAIGKPALQRAPIAWFVHDEDVERSAEWFEHRGPIVILLGRFVPGSRLPTYFAAGMLSIGFWRFALFAGIAVAIWAPLLGGVAMVLGRRILPWVELYEDWALWVFVLSALLLVAVVKFVVPAFTWRGRRRIVSRWKRLSAWEFWPPYVFYVPVVLYFLWLSLKHRSLSLFTAVNPGVEAGGFIGESKSEILEGLRATPEFLAKTRRIEVGPSSEDRMRAALAFMEAEGLSFPVVLKPDAGQRGSGVAVVKDEAEMAAWFDEIRVDAVVQECVHGEEFGVFYYRFPGDEHGHVSSITRKAFPKVVGDGHSTLERLILHDDRAVAMAKLHLDRHVHELWDVPAEGEVVRLVEIGNHCQGAVFLDGTDLVTEPMVETFDRVSRGLEGFYFGRYDVIAESADALREGRGFKIIELNGATAEATHIYDPKNGLFDAYRTLFEQWRILFAIAKRNVALGVRPVRWTELVRMMGRYRIAARSHPG